MIYILDKIGYKCRFDLENHDVESIWVEIKLKNSKPFLFCSVYRPLSSNAE